MTERKTRTERRVAKKIKKPPVKIDKRESFNPEGRPRIEHRPLTPEMREFCLIVASGANTLEEVQAVMPSITAYKRKTWLERANVLRQIEAFKQGLITDRDRTLQDSIAGEEARMYREILMSLTRLAMQDKLESSIMEKLYCKMKAQQPLSPSNKPLADKVRDVAPLRRSEDNEQAKAKDLEAKTTKPESLQQAVVDSARRPIWEDSDYEDIDSEGPLIEDEETTNDDSSQPTQESEEESETNDE